jgi:hypothetical protein
MNKEQKKKKCRHNWRYEHSVYSTMSGKIDFSIRRCIDCGQWQKGRISWFSVARKPVDTKTELDNY